MADELPVGADDAEVVSGDQKVNLAITVPHADADVPELSQVTEVTPPWESV